MPSRLCQIEQSTLQNASEMRVVILNPYLWLFTGQARQPLHESSK